MAIYCKHIHYPPYAPSCVQQHNTYVNLARCAYPFIIFFLFAKQVSYTRLDCSALFYYGRKFYFIFRSFVGVANMLSLYLFLFSVRLMWACVDINVHSLFIHMHYVLSNRLHSHWRRTSTQMNICSWSNGNRQWQCRQQNCTAVTSSHINNGTSSISSELSEDPHFDDFIAGCIFNLFEIVIGIAFWACTQFSPLNACVRVRVCLASFNWSN